MKFSSRFPLLVLASLLLTPVASATPLVAVGQVTTLARAALQEETLSLNRALAGAESDDYFRYQLQAIRQTGATRLAPNYLFDKCVYQEDHLMALMDDQLTLADDAAAGRGHGLSRLQTLYGSAVWSAIAQACANAEERFQTRLQHLTVRGQALHLDEDTIASLSTLLFYPTHLGQPRYRSRFRAFIDTVLSAAVFIGSTGSLVGLPIGGVILSFTLPVNSFLGLRDKLGGRGAIPLRPDAARLLDLSADERRLQLP